MMGRAALVALAILLSGCGEEKSADTSTTPATTTAVAKTETARPAAVPLGSGFDFYVLSLSWSPTWCENNDGADSSRQCAAGRGLTFIVHGLWPQNETGYPEFCRTRDSDRVPEALGRALFDIIPSMGLIGHEWRKHGTCSGLSQKDYFAVVRAARAKIVLPAAFQKAPSRRSLRWNDIETAVIAVNPGLRADAISVSCDGKALQDLRICMNKDLSFRSCPEVERKACKRPDIILPPAR